MGRIRQTFIKRTGEELIEKFADKFTSDFEENKKAVEEVAMISTKPLRNRIAGYVTAKVKKMNA
ncbi:30S ribosomal protein S17e [Methanococcus maripaludis]|uniref:Small ribosomal subunit protein eS17 n=5 Tax=Methanococcus maripaludis TaxID=39152 RepID=RS17E_METMP|nr:30S ribosomal protein S17e [Methanococcus maripaludis]Q6LZP7.1 RecName: Full=Small ribosomal subunit protein eS17; AltName: Full=30S ribosomal protein S17e [Methanococcus maripaludis S2]MDK2929118.1 small subunit ribosomal protein S17e [Methanococcus sp.]AEK19598.1 30S ribosomal protein S17e [Methanococcus maripaludis X1]AVB75825.1 30S ribosomal protein S17e [Methanococcus maripaludis]MBA2846385.1 small subunit ribosomal protein S17e [Methanococcus maripaludis]MBA2851052.1 small subunit ri